MDKAVPFEDGTPAWASPVSAALGDVLDGQFSADMLADFLPNATDLRYNGSGWGGGGSGGGSGNEGGSGPASLRRRRPRVFYAVFAGRRHFLAVHFKYTDLLLRLRLVSEVHLWDFCRCG